MTQCWKLHLETENIILVFAINTADDNNSAIYKSQKQWWEYQSDYSTAYGLFLNNIILNNNKLLLEVSHLLCCWYFWTVRLCRMAQTFLQRNKYINIINWIQKISQFTFIWAEINWYYDWSMLLSQQFLWHRFRHMFHNSEYVIWHCALCSVWDSCITKRGITHCKHENYFNNLI